MTDIAPAPGDLRMARLMGAIGAARTAIVELRGTMPRINDPKLTSEAAPVLATAQSILADHAARAEPTIADDIAGLLAGINQLPIPREDPDLGPLPGLKALRSARGNVREEFNAVLIAAKALGWRPSDPLLPEIGSTEVPGVGLDGMLRALNARIEAVEKLLEQRLVPEGERAPGHTSIQVALVRIFIKNLRIELSLAKLETRVKDIIDVAALGRAIENITELTVDFLATVRGIALKMTSTLRAASEDLRPKVRRVSGGFRTVVRRIVSGLRRGEPEVPDALPPDFDLERARAMILAGHAPPAAWRSWIVELDFAPSSLRSLAPLAGLTALQTLDLRGAQVSDLAPLAGLTALQRLYLMNTQVSDLAPLAGLTALQMLDLRGAQVSDLAPLAGLTALQRLYLMNTKVSDLAPLAGLTALQTLDLRGAQVSDLAPLAGLTALQTLDLNGAQVSDLAPLAGLTALQTLNLTEAQVSDLTPLAGLTALQTLNLTGAQVSDLAPLAGLTALQTLYLMNTKVSDLAPLAELENLKQVWVERNRRRKFLAKTLGSRGGIVKDPN